MRPVDPEPVQSLEEPDVRVYAGPQETGAQTARNGSTGPVLTSAAPDLGAVGAVSAGLGVSRVLASVLVQRGFTDAEGARRFLEANEVAPRGALGEQAAAGVLAKAITSDTAIAVHGDYDCDGVCSTAVLTLALRSMGATVIPRVPERSDGYGLTEFAIRELAATGAGVLIAVDCGITSIHEVAVARSLGMEAIVVDHHRPGLDGRLPDAAIVHPTLNDPDGLPMCAAAVAGILVAEVASLLNASIADLGIEELMALATVTDLMPLSGMNRTIVRHGLRRLATTRNLGLSALMDSAGIDRGDLSSRTLGFGLGPRINAAGRVRSASAALELILARDERRAGALAAELEGANAERRAIQQETLIAAEAQAAGLADRPGWVLHSADWHKGVIGIVAGSIAGRHHRPTIVLSVDGELATGSARSVPGFSVADAIDSCADLLERHGGHSAAAGLTIRTDRITEFTDRFAEVVDATLPPELRVPTVIADVVVSPDELTLDLAEELNALEPTGEGNRPPMLRLPSVICEKPQRMGEGRHARLQLRAGGATAAAVCFHTRDRLDVEWGGRADVVGRLEVNRFRGSEEPRFVIEQGVRSDVASVNDVDSRGWIARVEAELGLLATPGQVERAPESAAGRRVAIDVKGGRSGLIADLGARASAVFIVADLDRRKLDLADGVVCVHALDWGSLRTDPDLIEGFAHAVLLDPPPASAALDAVERSGQGFIHRLFGDAEVGFALKVNESTTDLEPHIRGFYADLRTALAGDGADLVLSMRGAGRFPRSPVQVARMIRVLDEIGAVALSDRGLPVGLSQPTRKLVESTVLAGIRREGEACREYLLSLRSVAA